MLAALTKLFSLGEKFVLTEEHKVCLDLLENTSDTIFLTGKAGTGKTTLINYFRGHTKKKVVVLAPTGIAALNIKGQTIHSFFKFPPRMIDKNAIRRNTNSRIYSDIDCIVIDEISMVRADLLDGIDMFLRLHGKDKNLPFGGIQMVFVGDMYQLPPVVRYEEMEVFARFYDSPYFFSANCVRDMLFHFIELQTIFRQKELEFVGILNKIRVGEVTADTFGLINERLDPRGASDKHIILSTTNKVAEGINESKLAAINQPVFVYKAEVEGNFPTEERNIPAELELNLKKGARVLFVKNDLGGQWVNGSTGVVSSLDKESIQVKLDETGALVEVHLDSWENIRYELDQKTGELKTEVLGKLKQFPLKLAWAVTIHKSQGMSFDKVCLDFSKSPFAHGQTYVALSRCRTLDGLVVTRKLWPNDVMVDARIIEFMNRVKRA
jgi:ATP-dependent DNA helicase PIF1